MSNKQLTIIRLKVTITSMKNTTPHIAILTPFLHHASGYGGITPWLVNLANGFIKKGARVDILANAKQTTSLEYKPLDPKINVINQGYHKYQAFRSLLRYLDTETPSVLLTAGHRYNAMGAWAKRLHKGDTKIFLSMHENLSAGSNSMSWFRKMMRFSAVRHLFPHTDGIISVSKGVADDLLSHGLPVSSSQVIYNPIVNQQLIDQSHEPIEHPWLIEKTMPVLVSVGRLEVQKDYPTLLRALAIVNQSYPCRLIIMGEGRERDSLDELAQELGIQQQLAMPGHIGNPFNIMRGCDLFVLSSAWEGFGNVIAEALAVGTPVVSTDCPSGPCEILNNGEFGPLVSMKDPQALANAICTTLDNPLSSQLLEQRGQSFNVQHSVDHYWETMLGCGK